MIVELKLQLFFQDMSIRGKLLESVKAQAPIFFKELDESYAFVSFDLKDKSNKDIELFINILEKHGISKNTSMNENRYNIFQKAIYEETDFESASLFSFQTMDAMPSLDPQGDSFIMNPRAVTKKFKYIYNFYKPYLVLTLKGLKLFEGQNVKGITIKPALLKKLGGKCVESKDFFIVEANTKLNMQLKTEDDSGHPVPRYFPPEMSNFIEFDMIENNQTLLFSKSLYDFVQNSPLSEDIEEYLCFHIQK